MIKRSHRGFHFHFHFHPSSKNCTHPGPLLCTLKIYLFTQKTFLEQISLFLISVVPVWYKTVRLLWVSDRPLTTTLVCVCTTFPISQKQVQAQKGRLLLHPLLLYTVTILVHATPVQNIRRVFNTPRTGPRKPPPPQREYYFY